MKDEVRLLAIRALFEADTKNRVVGFENLAQLYNT